LIQVEVPKLLRTRPRDHRGYVIPFVVLVDATGRAHFTINDVRAQKETINKRLCGICGKRLVSRSYWFVGGPGSALHPRGAYIDGPLHEECARYALKVCPYLAAGRYSKRIDAKTLDPADAPSHMIFFDPTLDPERPEVFCLGEAEGFALAPGDGQMPYFKPKRPWLTLEFWRAGFKVDIETGRALAREHLAGLAASGRGVG